VLFCIYKEKSQEDFMNKKTIFKIVGGVLAGIIVILTIVGVVYYKTTFAPMYNIMKNGHPAIASNTTLDMYYCKNETEESAVITKIAMDKYGTDSTEYITAVTRSTLATKESIDSETLDSLSIIFSVYTSLESIVPGYYVMYLKDSESICILYLEHDKQLAKLYGQSLKAANLQKSWLQEFSIQ